MKPKIAVLGPVTKDKIIIRKRYESTSPGGCVYYCGQALARLGAKTAIFMSVAKEDLWVKEHFDKEIKLNTFFKKETIHFENIYPRRNVDFRVQKTKEVNDPIRLKDIKDINFSQYDYVILGSIQANDFTLNCVKQIAMFDTKLCLSIQGFLRTVNGDKVVLGNFKDKEKFLKHADIVIMDENEAKSFMPGKSEEEICRATSRLGPKEVIITHCTKGSVIFSDDKMYKIPAFKTANIKDATGAGDSYLAGYIVKRFETDNLMEVGEFAAMTATIDTENKGAFNKDKKTVDKRVSIHNLIKKEHIHLHI